MRPQHRSVAAQPCILGSLHNCGLMLLLLGLHPQYCGRNLHRGPQFDTLICTTLSTHILLRVQSIQMDPPPVHAVKLILDAAGIQGKASIVILGRNREGEVLGLWYDNLECTSTWPVEFLAIKKAYMVSTNFPLIEVLFFFFFKWGINIKAQEITSNIIHNSIKYHVMIIGNPQL